MDAQNSPPGPRPEPPPDRAPSKVLKHGWVVADKPGVLTMLPKPVLNIDHEYQRQHVSHGRVQKIAAEWSWQACGTLTVGRRPDGTFWVIDGQHRKLAADKRADILTLPCMVFDVTGRLAEARGFLDINVQRGPVRSFDKFNALVMSGDPVATAVKAMVEQTGYQVVAHAKGDGDSRVRCVGTLCRCMRLDAAAARVAWALSANLFWGHGVQDQVYEGLWFAERHLARLRLGTLLDAHNRDALVRIGVDDLARSIREAVAYNGGGAKSCGEGIVRAINKGRRTRRIPGVLTVPDDSAAGDGGDPN